MKTKMLLMLSGHSFWPHSYMKRGGMFKSHCYADVQVWKKENCFIFSVIKLVFLLSPQQSAWERSGVSWRISIDLSLVELELFLLDLM